MQEYLYPTILPCVDPGPSSLDFSRESPAKDMWCYVAYVYNGELVFLIGNQWVGIFPPKSKILFVLSLALKWCRNFQDGTIPVGGDTWTSCTSEKRKKKNKNKNERDICQPAYAKSFAKTTGTNSPEGHATIQPKWQNFEKSRWTVRQQWLVVTRPLADCQTTFFRRFKPFGKISKKKSLNGHATVVGGHATVGRLSNNVFWTFKAIWKFFEKSHWTVTRQWSEVTRPSADCQTAFFVRFKQFEIFLKKVTERSRDSVRRSRDRRPTVKQRFSTFQAIQTNFEESRWRVTWQWSEVTRLSANCQTTFFRRFKQFRKFSKKVAERSRDSGRMSRDRWPTVKQRFFDVLSKSENFWKK